MSAEEYQALKADKSDHGLRQPLGLHEGRVLNGLNRPRACAELDKELAASKSQFTSVPSTPPASNKPLEDWLSALESAGYGLRKTGALSYNGPCPLCQEGHDRFHLQEIGGRVVVGCRQCLDVSRASYRELVKLLWPQAPIINGSHRHNLKPGAPVTQHRRAQPARSNTADVQALVSQGVSAAGTPAETYLIRHRQVWPSTEAGQGFPGDLRLHFLAAESLKHLQNQYRGLRAIKLPSDAVGALMVEFHGVEGLQAVELEALKKDGNRYLDSVRWRRTFGSRAGSVFLTNPPRGECPAAVSITEGVMSAVAATWLYPAHSAMATGGTSGFGPDFPSALLPHLPVYIHCDCDKPSRMAGRNLKRTLVNRGFFVHLLQHRKVSDNEKGSDLADALEERLTENSGKWLDSGLSEEEAISAAWWDIKKGTAP